MSKTLIVLLSLLAWLVIGCVIFALIDDENESLYKWVDGMPYFIGMLTIVIFPVFLFYWIKNRRGNGK